MKKIILVLMLLSFFAGTSLFAKKLKIATVNMNKVFENFDSKKEADNQIEAKQDKLAADLKLMQLQIEDLENRYSLFASTNVPVHNTSFPEELEIKDDIVISSDIMTEMADLESLSLKDPISNKSEIIDKKKELMEEINEKKDILVKYQERESSLIEQSKENYLYNLSGEVYEKIGLFAKKFDYDIVFNEKDILYSRTAKDITDLVILEINKI